MLSSKWLYCIIRRTNRVQTQTHNKLTDCNRMQHTVTSSSIFAFCTNDVDGGVCVCVCRRTPQRTDKIKSRDKSTKSTREKKKTTKQSPNKINIWYESLRSICVAFCFSIYTHPNAATFTIHGKIQMKTKRIIENEREKSEERKRFLALWLLGSLSLSSHRLTNSC